MQSSPLLEKIPWGRTFLPPGDPHLCSLLLSGAERALEVGRGGCGGTQRKEGSGRGGAGAPLETNHWLHCPPPAGFADRPERAGPPPSGLILPPRGAPVPHVPRGGCSSQVRVPPEPRPAGRARSRRRRPGRAGSSWRGAAEPEVQLPSAPCPL